MIAASDVNPVHSAQNAALSHARGVGMDSLRTLSWPELGQQDCDIDHWLNQYQGKLNGLTVGDILDLVDAKAGTLSIAELARELCELSELSIFIAKDLISAIISYIRTLAGGNITGSIV